MTIVGEIYRFLNLYVRPINVYPHNHDDTSTDLAECEYWDKGRWVYKDTIGLYLTIAGNDLEGPISRFEKLVLFGIHTPCQDQ